MAKRQPDLERRGTTIRTKSPDESTKKAKDTPDLEGRRTKSPGR